MRIGIGLLTLVPGRVGGSETYVRGLLAGLAAEASPHRWTAFANPAAARSLEASAGGAVAVRSVPEYDPGDGGAARLAAILRGRYASRRLARAVERRAGAFDLVHFPLTVPVPPPPGGSVVTVHDLQHEVMPEFFSRAERAYRAVVYTGAIRAAQALVTISEYSKETIVERHRVDPARVLVSPLAVDRSLFRPGAPDTDLLRELELPERFVVYPANLWPHKNHRRLLEALALVRDRELAIVLTGQRDGQLAALEEAAARLGLSGRVRHLGYVDRRLLPHVYRRALGMVFPSLFEGFGLPPLEALACGCPVAASQAASLPEVLRGHAPLFDPHDPEAIAAGIEWLLTAAPPRAGEEFWRGFTWAECARVHRAAYAVAAAG